MSSKKRDIVVSTRMRSDSLAMVLQYLRTKGYHPTTISDLVSQAVELVANSTGLERPSTADAVGLLSEIGLKSKHFTRQNITLNIELDNPILAQHPDSLSQRFDSDVEEARKIFEALGVRPKED